MKQLMGKVALITGGSKGIGLAAAQLLAEHGAKVIITGRDQKSLNIAKSSILGEVMCIQNDIADISQIDGLYDTIQKSFGKIDILFANAAHAKNIALDMITEEEFDSMVNVNYKGAFFTVQKALPYLNNNASIILNASIAGVIAFDRHSIYSSTKAAIIHMAKLFAADLAAKKIRVNSVSPGYVKTSAWDPWVNSPGFKSIENIIPFGERFGSAEEVANVVLFLASSGASYITGQNIVIDGGVSTLFLQNKVKK